MKTLYRVQVICNGKVLTVHKTAARALIAINKMRNQGILSYGAIVSLRYIY